MSTDTSGPAFPVDELSQHDGSVCAQHFGVTVRDYFAAKAMEALIAAPLQDWPENIASKDQHSVSVRAYELADAMLKARTQ